MAKNCCRLNCRPVANRFPEQRWMLIYFDVVMIVNFYKYIVKSHSWRFLRFQYLRRTTPQKTFFLTQRTSNEFAKSVIIISHQVISPCEGSLPPTEGLLLLTFIVVASIGWLWKSKLLKPVLSSNGRLWTHYQFN